MTRGERWIDDRKRAAQARPRIRIDSLELTTHPDGRGYLVVLKGYGLYRAITPPSLTVGGAHVQELQFQADGLLLRGVTPSKPATMHAILDYGFTRVESNA